MPPIQELNFSRAPRGSDADDNVTVSTIGTDSLFSKPLVESRWEAQGEQTFEASLEAEDWVPQSPMRQETKESIKYSRSSLLNNPHETTTRDRHASGLPFTTLMDASATTAAEDEEDPMLCYDGSLRRSANTSSSNVSPKLPVRQQTLSNGKQGMSVSCHSSTTTSSSSAKRSSWCREVSDHDVLKMPHRQRTLESIPSDYYRAYTDTVVATNNHPSSDEEDTIDIRSASQSNSNTTTSSTGRPSRTARIPKPAGLRAVNRAKTTPEKPTTTRNTRVPRSMRISATDSTATVRRRYGGGDLRPLRMEIRFDRWEQKEHDSVAGMHACMHAWRVTSQFERIMT